MCVFSISWHFTTYVTTSESRSQYSLRHSLFSTPHLLITLVKIGGQVETVLGPVGLYDQGVHPITDIVRIERQAQGNRCTMHQESYDTGN